MSFDIQFNHDDVEVILEEPDISIEDLSSQEILIEVDALIAQPSGGGGGGSWGSITGTISDQLDLNDKFSDYVNRGAEYYFTNTASDQGGGRYELSTTIPAGGGVGMNATTVANLEVLLDFASVTGYPNVEHIPSGVMSVRFLARQDAGTKVSRLYAEFYTRTNPGGVNTTIATTAFSQILTGSNQEIVAEVVTPVISGLLVTDRLCVRIVASVSGAGTDPDITIDIQGITHSRASIPMSQVYLGTLLDSKQDTITGSNYQMIFKNGSGTIIGTPNLTIDSATGGLYSNLQQVPNANTGSFVQNTLNMYIEPLQNSPNETWNLLSTRMEFDASDSGFTIGTNGQAGRMFANTMFHGGTGDIGAFEFMQNNFQIGNGTDPIDVKGFGYFFGFGQFAANVNISGPMQGYGFQFNVDPAATIDVGAYTNAFYDFSNIGCASPGYSSFAAGPTIASINNNNNYTGLSINPTIPTFTGNAGFVGIALNGNLGTFNNNGYYQGVSINPNITSARYAAGLQVTMDGVTPYAGVQSVLTVQDLTFTFTAAGDNNSYTLEYTSGGTAGSEVVTILGQAITIQIQSGVSTATQIKAAADGSPMASAITTTISGVGSDPQVTFGPTNFAGGINAGQVLAAYLDGDVQITGALSFSGDLNVAKINAFASQALTDGGGQPSSIHSFITNPTVAANVTLTSADTISVNTAALINIGDNAVVGTSFIGVAALGLPAVLTMGTASTLDRCYAALFALSLDAGAGGGTVDEVGLCKAISIPNGVTTVNKLKGFVMDLPFGDPGTTTWAFYDSSGSHNYFGGDLKIGDGTDVVANSSVALDIESTTKALLLPRMNTTQRDALTPIAGMVVFNSTTTAMEYYNGTSWV